jgi:hypothetical protein
MIEHPELYYRYQLMEMLGCGTIEELCERLKTSSNVTGWLVYLHEKDKREQERLKAMYGEQ